MKMLIIVYSDAFDEVMMSAFKEAHVKGYTKWKETFGEGNETEPKLGTHFWPGRNNVLAIVTEDEEVAAIKGIIKDLKIRYPKTG
ncbi:MAG TPA: hypothetical protein VMT62_06235, partial [Syntrophorhabdaceae bacterium]|nr:hypothetical protein [Syntrophorhabdaceae bacterium]